MWYGHNIYVILMYCIRTLAHLIIAHFFLFKKCDCAIALFVALFKSAHVRLHFLSLFSKVRLCNRTFCCTFQKCDCAITLFCCSFLKCDCAIPLHVALFKMCNCPTNCWEIAQSLIAHFCSFQKCNCAIALFCHSFQSVIVWSHFLLHF